MNRKSNKDQIFMNTKTNTPNPSWKNTTKNVKMKPFSDNKVPQNTKPHKPFSQICGLKRRNEEDPEEKSTKLLKPRC